jgi:hypothetical protein
VQITAQVLKAQPRPRRAGMRVRPDDSTLVSLSADLVEISIAIAKEIVEAHGGRIGVESVEGLGTRFRVALPVGAPLP